MSVTESRQWVVGGLIVNPQGRVYVQKRSPDRRLFPGCWDIAGGHVEPGETLFAALRREIAEETGWRLVRILGLVEAFDWEQTHGGRNIPKREFDFLVEVSGDLDHPQLEAGKFSEFRWVGLEDVGILSENRAPGDETIQRLVQKALNLYTTLSSGATTSRRPQEATTRVAATIIIAWKFDEIIFFR